jgi:hypothetical protein
VSGCSAWTNDQNAVWYSAGEYLKVNFLAGSQGLSFAADLFNAAAAAAAPPGREEIRWLLPVLKVGDVGPDGKDVMDG